MFIYRKLDVWQLAKEIAVEVYGITKEFPQEERFGLVSQINRAAVSVPSNIAEGCSRASLKEQAYFSEIAFGSLMELSCQLEISKDLGYIELHKYDEIFDKIEVLGKKISSLRKSQISRSK